MSRADNKEKYKEYDHNYYIKNKRPKSKIGQAELKIADLETKLAESKTRIEELESQFSYECECNKQFVDCQNENSQLKQQLAEKNKEVTRLKLLVYGFDKLKQYDKDADLILINPKTCYTDGKELVVKVDNQDKISLCIEKLEKVKKYAQHIQGKLINYIDDQIKQLKEK